MAIHRLAVASPGWLAAASLSLAAHVGVLVGVSTSQPSLSGHAAPALQVRVVAGNLVATDMDSGSLSLDLSGTPAVPSLAEPAYRPRVAAVAQMPPGTTGELHGFLPSKLLEVPPLPRSSPDVDVLTGVAASGLPIKLRLFVDARGHVVRIHVLEAAPLDMEAVVRLEQMFFETLFLPGKRLGSDVASYLDVEMVITDVE